MSIDPDRDGFVVLLDESVARCLKYARRHGSAAIACYVVAISASGATTLVAALGALPKPLIATLAAFPALALLFNNILRFDAKSAWLWKKVRFYDGLRLRVQFENYPLVDASKAKRDFDKQMEAAYPKFGLLPGQTGRNSVGGDSAA